MIQWTKIYETNFAYQAEFIKMTLESQSVPCMVIDKQDSSYLMFGQVELYVKQEDVLEALKIINDEIKFE